MRPSVGRLHVLTDQSVQQRYTHLELTQRAVAAGVPVVQYRHKTYDPARDRAELMAIAQLTAASATRLLVNDYLDEALAVRAGGVHLGQGDPDPAEALKRLGPAAVVGVTVHSAAECQFANRLPVHYVGIGPVFGTRSKATGLPPLGLAGLERLCRMSHHPVIAIGSITLETVPQVLACGAYGVAILSAFCTAREPEQVASQFLDALG
ncbi:MAG: thiamine phosphate synthase [Bacteroidia bacterium]|nr:thiamine phosphate synthase [Bacteroidia bacterium]